ncbi:uncharacterized protein LOC130120784 isoform X2 [Lampris incognitus]|uniref:uncharacterized protein LOC130120784 isoform X2 n=1 Tax=Lampris incognitus TaxID=2546036 RepID=UPI0024B5D31A|nr:uncharacterized protein LOC130120784 isoform X2 [Lampris incognitus]
MDTPNHKQWLTIIDDILVMETLTYRLQMEEGCFEKDWGKWSRSWEFVPGCEHVKHPLNCNLTDVFSNTGEIYYYQVTTVLGDQTSVHAYQPGFMPIKGTILDLPLLSVHPCGKFLCVGLQPPMEHMRKSYDSLQYELKIKSISAHGTEFLITTNSLKEKIVKDLAPGRQYCVSVRIADSVVGRDSNYSQPRCAFTNGIISDTAISLMMCLILLLGLLTLPLLFWTGFIGLKTPLPPLLASIQHRLETQLVIPCDEPLTLARYSEPTLPSVGRKGNINILEHGSEGEADMESTVWDERGGYEPWAAANPLPASYCSSSSSSSSSCPNPPAVALQTDLFTFDPNQTSPNLSPLSILAPQPSTAISGVIQASELGTLKTLAVGIIGPTDEEEEAEEDWSGQDVNLLSLTFGGNEEFSEEKSGVDTQEEEPTSSSDTEESPYMATLLLSQTTETITAKEVEEEEEEEEECSVYVGFRAKLS